MKNKINLVFRNQGLLFLFLLAISACGEKKSPFLHLKNPLSVSRENEGIVLTKQQVEKITGKIDEGKIPLLKSEKGDTIPYQLDDLDQNGLWDELAFEVNMAAEEELKIAIDLIDEKKAPSFPQMTNVRLGIGKQDKKKVIDTKSYKRTIDLRKDSTIFIQMEGPAWENDKVTFRIYFDPRNGIDIFGKTTAELVMDKVGLGDNYHALADWGMDILKVGNSLGAGSIALMEENQLIRLGETKSTSFDIIAEGPVRAILRLTFEGWQVGEESLKVTQTISIWKGHYYYKNQVKISGFKGEKALVSGIVNLHSDSSDYAINEKYVSLLTFDKQSENKDYLGMALLTGKEYFKSFGQTSEKDSLITDTYYMQMKIKEDKVSEYYFFAGWEKSSDDFKNLKSFQTSVDNACQRLFNPVIMDVK